jgi:hypothetical protein
MRVDVDGQNRGERDGGRFPPLDRLDLIENGRILAGSDASRRGLPRPSSRELRVSSPLWVKKLDSPVTVC